MDDDTLVEQPREPRVSTAPVFRAPKAVSRPKPRRQMEEELGANPLLGDDFEDAHPFSIAEAKIVVDTVYNARATDPRNPLGAGQMHNDSETIIKFRQYFEDFAKPKGQENVQAISSLFDSYPMLTPVERAQLGSLYCENADEAKTLVPSLIGKISDDHLQELCEEVWKLRRISEDQEAIQMALATAITTLFVADKDGIDVPMPDILGHGIMDEIETSTARLKVE